MYVILPDSYNLWAADIVLLTLNPSFLEASCCKVEVVKGAEADFLKGFLSIDKILNLELILFSKKALASSKELKPPECCAINSTLFALLNLAETLNEEFEIKSLISFSLSTKSLTATD